MSNTIQQRSNTVDTVKCLLILSIYVFHFGEAAGNWYLFFSCFHVPSFFMVSGFWAMKHLQRSVWDFLKQAFFNYLLLWLCWVCIYPVYYALAQGYGLETTWGLFVQYFCGKRSGIGGMWFVPAFFLVTLCYFLTAKLLSRLPRLSETGQALLHFALALTVYLVYRNNVDSSLRLLFSLDQVPVHWMFYALGRVLFCGYEWLRRQKRELQRGIFVASAVLSFGYMLVIFYDRGPELWGALGRAIPVFPLLADAVLPLCGLFWLAKVISCRFLGQIGRNTLGLCLCEILVKYPFTWLMEHFGLPLDQVWMVFLIAVAAILLGHFIVLPPFLWAIRQLQARLSPSAAAAAHKR